MAGHTLIFRIHALQRMFERSITVADVQAVVTTGEVIRAYPDDTPYPSQLLLGWIGPRPLHVVIAENAPDNEYIVVTAYEPDPAQWEADFKRKRP
jgi:hypothetical protein